ncbi:ferrochelatase [Campylobacter curvus]|uniref:ferrochelatase n=1 Tax=Campylobacter curvus TaxID=200 RepID=UPI0003744D96|nr:ferrochelatase [Campylobacter curvus]QKF61536.1 ferrochelatase [Campylobacter curvus]UEB49840.1 ferrochelatase [Campylobacter curvus]
MKKLILLLNMGGPSKPEEIEIFLKNMFNDPCILGIKNKILRKFVAMMITKGRLKTAQRNYAKIGGKSPICELIQALCDKISNYQDEYAVDFAMNYTPPFTKDVLARYQNFDEVIVLPLYPHHSVTTVVSSLNDLEKACKKLNFKGEIRVLKPFYDEQSYNELIIKSIKNKILGVDISDMSLIFSAHSLPQKIIDNGDIYEAHVKEHVKILSKMLNDEGLKFKEIKLAYQSRLGPVKWLEPPLNEALKVCESKKALIYPISFCIDNSETIFELVIEYKRVADELGFSFYDVVECPNFSDEFVNFILRYAVE